MGSALFTHDSGIRAFREERLANAVLARAVVNRHDVMSVCLVLALYRSGADTFEVASGNAGRFARDGGQLRVLARVQTGG